MTYSKFYKSITSSFDMENINQEILNKINQIQIDIEIIKERTNDDFEEAELTDWAKNELAEARKIPDSELLSSEEVKQMILGK